MITQIDFDHENFLGHSIGKSPGKRRESSSRAAGGQRRGAPDARVVIAAAARKRCAFLVEIDTECRVEILSASPDAFVSATPAHSATRCAEIRLPGRFQVRNALTALAAARMLAERGAPIDDEAIARLRGDVAGPPRKMSAHPKFTSTARTIPPAHAKSPSSGKFISPGNIFLIYGAMRDKAVDEIAGLLFPRAHAVILTEPRSLAPSPRRCSRK